MECVDNVPDMSKELCHIGEPSSNWLTKPEDAFNIGDRIDVKLIEVNEKGQPGSSHWALLPDPDDTTKPQASGSSKENIHPKENPKSDRVPFRRILVNSNKSLTSQDIFSEKNMDKAMRRPVMQKKTPAASEDEAKLVNGELKS